MQLDSALDEEAAKLDDKIDALEQERNDLVDQGIGTPEFKKELA